MSTLDTLDEREPWTSERARVASLSRSRPPDDPDLLAARERLAFARVEERVRRAVADAPALPERVAQRLTAIIRAARRDDDRVTSPLSEPAKIAEFDVLAAGEQSTLDAA